MQPWQEDNVIFFKVAHINEQAGYMGKGILGEGPYRHTITPYYLLYKIFGYNIPVYYSLMFLSYFIATVCIYLLVKEILGKKAGMIAPFLFGAGYIASEGFFRVYTSTNISSGIAMTSLLFLSFWKYFKSRKIKWYLLTVLLYFLTIQVSYVRVHYLILPLLVFDFLFLVLPKLSNIKWFLLRSIPFLLIFHEFYIVQGDSRREGVIEVGKALLSGKFEYLTSFLGTFGNLIVPDFFQKFPVLVGVVSLFIFVLIAFMKLSGEKRKLFIFLSAVIVSNILAYSIYTPFTVYATNYRYLAHSFFAFSIILSLASLSKKKIFTYLIVLWGVMFLILNVKTQNNILEDRTSRITSFYEGLKREMPTIPKDAVVYFDIEDSPDAKKTYAVSFSVAEMPETTAIAWRYGIDRYDFKMFTEFKDVEADIKENKVPKDKIYSFWLTGNGLINTSDKFRKILSPSDSLTTNCSLGSELVVSCLDPINSVLPVEISFDISALAKDVNSLTFPLSQKDVGENPFYSDSALSLQAIDYQKKKAAGFQNSIYTPSSNWKDRVITNINDNDPGTVWQSDRVAWGSEQTFFTIRRLVRGPVSRLVILPGHKNNIPSELMIDVSQDGSKWVKVDSSFKADGEYLVVDFEKIDYQFIRTTIKQTSGGDSPQIAEAWLVGSEFDNLSILNMETFLAEPFAFVKDAESYGVLVDSIGGLGKIKISWKGDKSEKWLSENNSEVETVYNGKIRSFKLMIPAGGTYLDRFMLSPLTIPGEVAIHRFSARSARVETP